MNPIRELNDLLFVQKAVSFLINLRFWVKKSPEPQFVLISYSFLFNKSRF
ncbi:hypothetical protein LLB_3874 [Legionella longbeachae D-4968]|nr:hypothetical protein LLB_3874 [Legionella longbeachae D-4968]